MNVETPPREVGRVVWVGRPPSGGSTADIIADLRAYSRLAGSPLVLELAADELSRLFEGSAANARAQLSSKLSTKQLQVLSMIAKGFTYKEIGKALNMSHKTANSHATRVFQKLGAAGRTDAVIQAYRMGLV